MTQNFHAIPRLLTMALVLVLSLSAAAFAQETNSTISGTVKDSAGAAVNGATVTIIDVGTNLIVRTTTTNDDGQFSASNLPATFYDVNVEAPNFKKAVVSKFKLDVGQNRTMDITLETGNISEVVVVDAVPVGPVEHTDGGNGNQWDQVRELSLNNRNWVQLVALRRAFPTISAIRCIEQPIPRAGRIPSTSRLTVRSSEYLSRRWRRYH